MFLQNLDNDVSVTAVFRRSAIILEGWLDAQRQSCALRMSCRQ
jgi:hypothetical protein